jgi:Family of unknown function (DUF6174)
MHHARAVATCIALLLAPVLGCAGDDDEDSDNVARSLDDIRAEQRSWKKRELENYTFVWVERCFCPIIEPVGGVRVEVHDGEVVSAIGQQSGIPHPGIDRDIDYFYEKAIAGLQSLQHVDALTLRFDRQNHVLAEFVLDATRDGSDDEYSLAVTCFDLEPDACPIVRLTEAECTAQMAMVVAIDEDKRERICRGGISIGQVDPGKTVCCRIRGL